MINTVELERALNLMRPMILGWSSHWVYPNMAEWVTNGGTLYTPLTSTSWDGDARSTTARTLIDLSAVFGAPAGIKAILVKVTIRDSGSAGGDYSFNLTPASGAGEIAFTSRCSGLPNDRYTTEAGIVPCDANGDVYYQIAASGASTMDVTLQIWGYYI